jgi:hypothetical protein
VEEFGFLKYVVSPFKTYTSGLNCCGIKTAFYVSVTRAMKMKVQGGSNMTGTICV